MRSTPSPRFGFRREQRFPFPVGRLRFFGCLSDRFLLVPRRPDNRTATTNFPWLNGTSTVTLSPGESCRSSASTGWHAQRPAVAGGHSRHQLPATRTVRRTAAIRAHRSTRSLHQTLGLFRNHLL